MAEFTVTVGDDADAAVVQERLEAVLSSAGGAEWSLEQVVTAPPEEDVALEEELPPVPEEEL